MKICVISSQIFPVGAGGLVGYGGLEQIAWLCAKGLAERGHHVALVAPDGSWCPNVQHISNGPPGQLSEEQGYGKYWQTLGSFDVIVDHSWQKWTSVGRKEGWLKAPILAVCHAPVNTMFKELSAPGLLAYVCISEDQANHFRNLFGRDCRVAYNGVDLTFYKPLGIPRSGRFLFLARFSTIKGPDLAIAACLQAGVGLDLIGDTSITNEPELYHRCMALARQESPSWDHAQNGQQIRVVGPATRGECVWWFSQARCMLHPNERFREPFGLAPVEALACGCPVIAWDNGAMRETLSPQVGSLVGSFNGLVDAVRETDQKGALIDASYRERCRKQAEKFSVANMVARYEKLCLEAIQSGG